MFLPDENGSAEDKETGEIDIPKAVFEEDVFETVDVGHGVEFLADFVHDFDLHALKVIMNGIISLDLRKIRIQYWQTGFGNWIWEYMLLLCVLGYVEVSSKHPEHTLSVLRNIC